MESDFSMGEWPNVRKNRGISRQEGDVEKRKAGKV